MQWFLFNEENFNTNEYNECLSLMDDDRKKKILSINHQPTQRMSVFGEWAAKLELSKLTNKKPQDVKIARTNKGKPYAVNIPYCFSISHSANLLALAIDKQPIGIDIEIIKPFKKDVSKKICTENDLTLLNKSNDENDRNLTLYKIWTAKEAYYKMQGCGITNNLKNISYCEIPAQHFIESNYIITIVNTKGDR